jgi:SAM-dependent methyltransferase
VLDYDREAARYDATRGGDARADAAAAAIDDLLARSRPGVERPGGGTGDRAPGNAARIVDVGCGTGIVTVRLTGAGRDVLGVDRSAGMAAVAAGRMPGRITLGDVTRLPVASGSADAVTMVWLLHLLSPADSALALAEAARILRPGGTLIATVNKNDAGYHPADEASLLVQPVRGAAGDPQADDADRVTGMLAGHGLTPAARTTFTGLGQGLSPRKWRERLSSGHLQWTLTLAPDRMAELDRALARLPGQDRPRPDPEYQLLALRNQQR